MTAATRIEWLAKRLGGFGGRMLLHYVPTPLDLPPPPDPYTAARLQREYQEKRARQLRWLADPLSDLAGLAVVTLGMVAVLFAVGPSRELWVLLRALVAVFI